MKFHNPDFTVHSLFDERPQELITLRMLLSHTAGFTREAPVGNNYDLDPGTWETHVASISETWLKVPVGQHYAYSNLGIDLAGYIVQVASGVPFHAYVRARILQPLGMTNSTMDRAAISARPRREIGHSVIFVDILQLSARFDALALASGGAAATRRAAYAGTYGSGSASSSM